MKINYHLMTQIIPFFSELAQNAPIKFSTKRKLMRFNEKLISEYQLFQAEIQKLAELYCEKDESGELIADENGDQKIKPDKVEEANKALSEIHETEIEIDYEKFKLEEDYFENFIGSAAAVRLIEENFLLEEAETE